MGDAGEGKRDLRLDDLKNVAQNIFLSRVEYVVKDEMFDAMRCGNEVGLWSRVYACSPGNIGQCKCLKV